MSRIVKFALVLFLVSSFVGVPSRTSAQNARVVLQGFPLLRQGHSLTCEASAVSMATEGQLLERQIMAVLPRHPNPNLGFRGNPDGQQGTKLIDYGVYAGPLQKALLRFGYRSEVISYGTDAQLMSYVSRGWPIVAWVTYNLQPAVPRMAWAEGTQFFLVPHEHVVLVVGYDGASFIANDPWTAKQVHYEWTKFNRAWGYFARMALAVDPCPLPQPVTNLRADGPSDVGETWSWNAGTNNAKYRVRLIRHGLQDRVVYDGAQTSRSYTLLNPTPGALYEIVIRSLSPCGDASASRRLFTLIRSTSPPTSSPTASPTPSTTAPVESSPPPRTVTGPSPTPTATAPATPSPTPTARA